MRAFTPARFAQRLRLPLLVLVAGTLAQSRVLAIEVDEAKSKYLRGEYEACIQICEQAVKDNEPGEEFRALLVESLSTLGRHAEARKALDAALTRYNRSLRLRLIGMDIYPRGGGESRTDELLKEIDELGRSRMWAYRNPSDLVAFGRAALLMGADPKLVLENLFEQAKRLDPAHRDPYLAIGELALKKHDAALAAKYYAEGLKKNSKDPDLHYGLAKAHSDGDRKELVSALEAALSANPRHIPSMLLRLDHEVDAEEYAAAKETIAAVLKIDGKHSLALAYRAVLAHLAGDAAAEAQARAEALEAWKRNPEVDHLIGLKLSQKYRFREGALHQRKALEFEPKLLAAKIQLSQDLLRLGNEAEGWNLAETVHQADGYDINAYNLVTLKDTFAKFTTLTNAHFVLRMESKEADVYGARVLDLLERAREKLCPKYGITLEKPTIVEIFHRQSDFAVRTFGMPGNPGFLGVCFGDVITANSPATQPAAVNWEAVLWHEFCHTVTLNLSRNRMPRWLSEGISVYEERQKDPAWGQHMNPKYRDMILGEDFVPISKLSGAFLAPKTSGHLQFAYFESSLAVEYLIGRYGVDSIRGVLADLRDGIEINTALAKRTVALEKLEIDFAAYAKTQAEALGPGLDWTRPKGSASAARGRQDSGAGGRATRGGGLDPDLTDVIPSRAEKNFWLLTDKAVEFLKAKQWMEAETILRKLLAEYPDQRGDDSAYAVLARLYQEQGQTAKEKEMWQKLGLLDGAVPEACDRLMELCGAEQDWQGVVRNAQRSLALNPLLPAAYRHLAEASEKLNQNEEATKAYKTMLLLDPPDPAQANYRLALLLHKAGDPLAKRHVLQSLELAPRFREAQRLLLDLNSKMP